MNRLIAAALVTEALTGRNIIVLTGSPRDQLVFFRAVEQHVQHHADTAGPDFAAEIDRTSGGEKITFPGLGGLWFAGIRRPLPTGVDADIVYVDCGSLENAGVDGVDAFDTAIRDLQLHLPAAELVYSDGER